MEERNHFDIVVIGGGHAGTEAAWMASQFENLKVAIITMPGVPLASAPCNPSVGGVGKGQVVREIDALGGLMGRLADLSGLQWRTLNESKGHAVWSTRAQIDKELYPKEARRHLLSRGNISLIQERVEGVSKGDVFNIVTKGNTFSAKKVVVTTGTFLNGRLHVGGEHFPGGRPGIGASGGLGDIFDGVKTLGRRFKTGTPPRIDRKTIDFSKLKPQPSNPKVPLFHYAHRPEERFLEQIPCYLTSTNAKTMEIVRQNREKSPLFNGQIEGVGARYCPSLEDKAYRYPHRQAHHIFLEPETLGGGSYYPSGISSSLPREVQCAFVRTIEGLERAEILVYGHAVEYDVVDTRQLDMTLQHRSIGGLYFAGQVNGTSGYEEAAGQGLVAGVNAALSQKGRETLALSREDSYIGVMIEDLIGQDRDDPYRLFTARCENRLLVREDNALVRMAPYRAKMGLNGGIDQYQRDFLSSLRRLEHSLLIHRYGKEHGGDFDRKGYGPLRPGMNLADLLKRSGFDPAGVLEEELKQRGQVFDRRAVMTAAISAKYEGHIARALEEGRKQQGLLAKRVDWETMVTSPHIANECRERIKAVRPQTFFELQRIEGLRPATLAYVASAL